MKNLTAMRADIDVIDSQIIDLLGQRFELTKKVGVYKADHALPAGDVQREQDQFSNYKKLAELQGVSEVLVSDIFKSIIEEVKIRHKRLIN
jgi:chorismate mutase